MRSFTLMLGLCACFAVGVAGMSSAQSSPSPAQAPKTSSTAHPKQTATSSQTKAAATSGSQEVGPNTPVVTIKGVCSTPAAKPKAGTAAAKPAPCQTVITKAQLEKLIETVRPNLAPAQRKQLAEQYAELLIFADAGKKAGVEKDPKVQEQLQLARMQTLARAYSQQLQKESGEVSQADIEKYYNENSSKFEEAKLLRIYIPTPTTAEGKPDEAATKALAEKIQKRAAAGEDFDKLQKEAYTEANNKGAPPSADMGERRRGTLPPKQEETVFQLKTGEVSAPLEESSGAYIYKVVSKDKAPLDKVKDEIKGTLSRERFREAMEKLRASAKPTFNEAYFAPPAPPSQPAPAQPAPQAPPAPAPQTTTSGQPAQGQPAQPAAPEAPKNPPPNPPQSK